MRFYNLDGNEIDVQDVSFFIDEDELLKEVQKLEELLDYVEDVSMDK